VRRREGRYLLRTNLRENDPAKLWSFYLQLVAVEEAFRNLKGDLAIRPIFHQDEKRTEAISLSLSSYCLHVTLGHRARNLASGTYGAQRVGKVHGGANDRRACANHRWARARPDPSHTAGAGTAIAVGETQTGVARTAAAADQQR
jgi:hypothetical protein